MRVAVGATIFLMCFLGILLAMHLAASKQTPVTEQGRKVRL